MSSRAETAPYMADATLPEKIIGSTLGRIFLTALQSAVGGIAVMLLLLVWHPVGLEALKYILVAAIGLLAGFSARVMLAQHTRMLKLSSAVASAALSLMLISVVTGGFVGIDLANRPASAPNWPGLVQYGIAACSAWLALLARRSHKEIKVSSSAIPVKPAKRSRAKLSVSEWAGSLSLPSVDGFLKKISRVATTKLERLRPGKTTALKVQRADLKTPTGVKKRTQHKKAVTQIAAARNEKPVSIAQKRKKKKSAKKITLDSRVEHNCPYCLERVEPHDRRGVKICPICKTYHHADCWGITGACQIPHAQK